MNDLHEVNGKPVQKQSDVASIGLDRTSITSGAGSTRPAVGDAAADPFDLTSLRLPDSSLTTSPSKRISSTIRVGKPSDEQFFRCHPDEEFNLIALVLELKEDREFYLVSAELHDELENVKKIRPRQLVNCVTYRGELFLWPLNMPGPDGRLDSWSRSAHVAAEKAKKKWIRLESNMSLGAYQFFEATGLRDEPDWSIPTIKEVLKTAFGDRVIRDLGHPVLRRLRGEI